MCDVCLPVSTVLRRGPAAAGRELLLLLAEEARDQPISSLSD
jgi:hypothetical protein